MALTFVVGTAADAFAGDLAGAVEDELRSRYSFTPARTDDRYESEPVNAAGWRDLQNLMSSMLGAGTAPQVTEVDAYQAVYIPAAIPRVDHVQLPGVADPLQVASLGALVDQLTNFAGHAGLPTGDLELMGLAADYLEAGADREHDFQTYVQLMLSARQAMARKQALWIVS
ncbi:MAG TPA: hypothetical protein VF057_09830 [Thermoanaerobaculia bacterium]